MQGICQKTMTDRIFYIVFNFSKLNLFLYFFIRQKVEIARHENRIVATSIIATKDEPSWQYYFIQIRGQFSDGSDKFILKVIIFRIALVFESQSCLDLNGPFMDNHT
jgi:hypothetical protein